MRIPTLAATMVAAATVVALPIAANAAPPVAVSDTAQAAFETAEVVNVLANDTGGDAALTVTGKTNGAHGTVSCTAAGACTYTPATGWVGGDTFTYTVSDGTTPVTGTVTVETGISMITASSTPAAVVATTTDRNPTHKFTGLVTGPSSVPAPGVQVQLYKRTDLTQPKVAVPGGLVTSGTDGKIVVTGLTTLERTYYSWKSVAGKSSARERIVTVTPFLTTTFGDKKFAEGGDLTVTATAGPVTSGQNVVLQRKEATGWENVEIKQFPAPEADNSATVAFTPVDHPDSGAFLYKVVVPEVDNVRNTATSGQKTIEVYDAKITNVETANSDEFVTVKNIGLVPINLKDWQLSGSGKTITLPKRGVAQGGIVRIHSGKGTNDGRNLYLGRTGTLWPTTGTVALWDDGVGSPRVQMDEFTFVS